MPARRASLHLGSPQLLPLQLPPRGPHQLGCCQTHADFDFIFLSQNSSHVSVSKSFQLSTLHFNCKGGREEVVDAASSSLPYWCSPPCP